MRKDCSTKGAVLVQFTHTHPTLLLVDNSDIIKGNLGFWQMVSGQIGKYIYSDVVRGVEWLLDVGAEVVRF